MMRFSFLRQPRNVALVSYHIPKTAGTSFRKMLEAEFGKNNVVGLYNPQEANAFSKGAELRFKTKFSEKISFRIKWLTFYSRLYSKIIFNKI